MEESNFSDQSQPQNTNPSFTNSYSKVPLPNSVGSLVLGIISIFFGLIWCYWIGSAISLVCGIIGIVLSRSGDKLLDSNPEAYTESSKNNNNAGKVMSIIGLCLASLGLVIFIIMLVFFGAFASIIGSDLYK